jgi:hypothetical protein
MLLSIPGSISRVFISFAAKSRDVCKANRCAILLLFLIEFGYNDSEQIGQLLEAVKKAEVLVK